MHRLLTGLAEAFDTTVVTHDGSNGPEGQPVDPAEVHRALPGVRYLPVPGRHTPKRPAQVASLPRRRSFGYGRYATSALRRAVLGAAGDARLVHFDDPGSALSGRVPGAVNIVAPHDIESLITLRSGEQRSSVRRAFARIDGRKQAREEQEVFRRVDLCVAVSDVDAALLGQAGARSVAVCPNGTDPVTRLSSPRRAPGEPLRLLFVGNGDFQPNEQGLKWLIESVLPRVTPSLPTALDVVGRPPAQRSEAPYVRYHGQVPDLRPHYDRAHVAVAPIPFGSGTRLKIVEAMAHGRPVVSTSAGAEGLPARAGRHYIAGDNPDEFAGALLRVGEATSTADAWLEGMLTEAREVAERLFWPRIARNLAEVYRAAIEGSLEREVRSA